MCAAIESDRSFATTVQAANSLNGGRRIAMATNAYLAFLRHPDQDARRAELAAFFGPNADKFMPVYDVLQKDAVTGTGRPKFRLGGGGFSVPAFLCGPVWFFYRRMWAIAGVIVAGLVAIALIPGTSHAGLPIGLVLGLIAYRTYVQHAIGAIQKLRGAGGTVDRAAIAQAGGVSKTAGWISGLVYGLLALAAIVSIVILVRAGEPIPQ